MPRKAKRKTVGRHSKTVEPNKLVAVPEFTPSPTSSRMLYLWAQSASLLLTELVTQNGVRLPFPHFDNTADGLKQVIGRVRTEERAFINEWMRSNPQPRSKP